MGFTFSHPALILPCKYFPKRFYSLSGLIAGSMIPDLEYFIRWNTISIYSHTLKGIFWFDLPFALICILLYHLLIRDPLIDNLPFYFRSRLTRFKNFNWLAYLKKNWVIVICSILIGTASHLFWDSFTSYDGYFVKKDSFLMQESHFFMWKTYPYKLLKYSSSIVGLIVLFYQLSLLKPDEVEIIPLTQNKNYWILATIVSVPLITWRTYITDPDDFSLNSFVKTSISSILFAILTSSIFFRKKRAEINYRP